MMKALTGSCADGVPARKGRTVIRRPSQYEQKKPCERSEKGDLRILAEIAGVREHGAIGFHVMKKRSRAAVMKIERKESLWYTCRRN
ncbi:hypothetical protein AALB64_08775 [Lachnospiraceae bacterium 45-P1]